MPPSSSPLLLPAGWPAASCQLSAGCRLVTPPHAATCRYDYTPVRVSSSSRSACSRKRWRCGRRAADAARHTVAKPAKLADATHARLCASTPACSAPPELTQRPRTAAPFAALQEAVKQCEASGVKCLGACRRAAADGRRARTLKGLCLIENKPAGSQLGSAHARHWHCCSARPLC